VPRKAIPPSHRRLSSERPLYTGVENRGCKVYWRLIKLGFVSVELGPGRVDARRIVARFHPMFCLSFCFRQRRKEEFVCDGNLPHNSILSFNASLTDSELTVPSNRKRQESNILRISLNQLRASQSASLSRFASSRHRGSWLGGWVRVDLGR
jgi:hypothetical protein